MDLGESHAVQKDGSNTTRDKRVSDLLYYFDQSFMVCYTLPNLFTGHIIHDHLLPVTTGKIVHSQVQK